MTGRHRAEGPRRRLARRLSTILVVAGIGTIGAGSIGMLTASATDEPGANFGALDISTSAYGLRVPFFTHSGEDVESELPYSLAQLSYSGHALTSVYWPGDTGGHGGDTFKLLTGSCIPPNPFNTVPVPLPVPLPDLPCLAQIPPLPNDVYENMNDPYKAEAQSGSGEPEATVSQPGVEMKATATKDFVRATTVMAGGQAPGLNDGVGSSATDTQIKLTGPNTAVVDSVSVMRDVNLGGGALTIESVQSVAHAVTDGKTATGTASTTVQGMKVGGIPVTVDDQGIHVQGQGQTLPSIDALNGLLKNFGLTVFVANPTKTVKNAAIQLFSGQLIIKQDNEQYTGNLNDTGAVVTLGGATINADSSRAYTYDGGPVSVPTPPPPTGTTGATVSPTGTSGGTIPPPGGVTPEVATTAPDSGVAPVLAAHGSPLPGGVSPGWVVAVLLGSGLVAAGLKRLPDELFTDRGPSCSLGGQS